MECQKSVCVKVVHFRLPHVPWKGLIAIGQRLGVIRGQRFYQATFDPPQNENEEEFQETKILNSRPYREERFVKVWWHLDLSESG